MVISLHSLLKIFVGFLVISNNACRTFCCNVVSWESEATPLATSFFKRAYKISHPPRLWVSWIDLPSFATSSKIWPNFSNKVVEKLILSKNANNKLCASKFVFFNEKKIEKDSDDFGHRKFILKVQFLHFGSSW